MKKLLYIGHSYHAKTQSTQFLIEYLRGFYDVTVYLNDVDAPQAFNTDIITKDYSVIIFFQLIPEKSIFKKIVHPNIIFFPMYDFSYLWTYDNWYTYKNIKIFNFSKTLHEKLIRWGFNSHYIQYFIKPIAFQDNTNNEVFFWQRLTFININTIIKLFENRKPTIHLHKNIDPCHTYITPTKAQEKKYNISYSTWFKTKDDMQELIQQKTFYIAPRDFEGIGMSFLEAMAMGKIVIAHDKPTMNEYIVNGFNGYLCDFINPRAIEFGDIDQIRKNTYKFMYDGYENWLKQRHEIIDFIESASKKYIIPMDIVFTEKILKQINKIFQIIKKIIKCLMPYGIIRLIQKIKNKKKHET